MYVPLAEFRGSKIAKNIFKIYLILHPFWLYILLGLVELVAAAPYPVRPARPWPYLDFEK